MLENEPEGLLYRYSLSPDSLNATTSTGISVALVGPPTRTIAELPESSETAEPEPQASLAASTVGALPRPASSVSQKAPFRG